jgi:hypothetical protein
MASGAETLVGLVEQAVRTASVTALSAQRVKRLAASVWVGRFIGSSEVTVNERMTE